MVRAKPIYVEIDIRAEMDAVWTHTQTPELHRQWDLRFSDISYMPKEDEAAPQRFRYRTNIGFGLSIDGFGETSAVLERNGERMSVLKFWSDQPISLIREGSGYWKYVPVDGGVRFFTRYDYRTRFGAFGSWLDKLVFRPLMGWATAWSFDALRLWLEKGIHPKLSLYRALTELVCRMALALAWIYQGLFPKLLYPQSGELDIMRSTGLFRGNEHVVIAGMGVAELVFGALFLLMGSRKRRLLYLWSMPVLVALGLGAVGYPSLYVAPFNPVSLTLCMLGLAAVGLLSQLDLPDTASCRRQPQQSRRLEEEES